GRRRAERPVGGLSILSPIAVAPGWRQRGAGSLHHVACLPMPGYVVGDTAVRVQDRGVVAAEVTPDRGEAGVGELACEVHGDLACECDARPAILCEQRLGR